jgi:hypothetical protein
MGGCKDRPDMVSLEWVSLEWVSLEWVSRRFGVTQAGRHKQRHIEKAARR